MKAKKALKRISEVEQILAGVQEKYVQKTAELEQVLQATNASLLNAKAMIETADGAAKPKPVASAGAGNGARRAAAHGRNPRSRRS